MKEVADNLGTANKEMKMILMHDNGCYLSTVGDVINFGNKLSPSRKQRMPQGVKEKKLTMP